MPNHGFLLTPDGWKLSPAFDLNPDPDGHGLTLNITETDNSLDFAVALDVAEYFRLDTREANRILEKTKQSVAGWRGIATALGISGLPDPSRNRWSRRFRSEFHRSRRNPAERGRIG